MSTEDESGFKRIVSDKTKDRAETTSYLEGKPFETTTFSPEAINKIILINKVLKGIMNKPIPVEDALAEIQQYLSTHTWRYVFTSGEVEPSAEDSIYYVTPEGASLRLKRYNVKATGDITKVVIPFHEKIFFFGEKNKIHLEPKIGSDVKEYISSEFLKLQRSNVVVDQAFKSEIRVYNIKPGDMPLPGGGLLVKNVPNGHEHQGNKVTSILSQ